MKHWKTGKKVRHGGVAEDIFAWHENEKSLDLWHCLQEIYEESSWGKKKHLP